ncbi:unnamed protein product [Cylicocyclus nassatus]|uniref:Uncharacterized protein n=1 Tax=Cylicocyclus nassatus TaxID=53992 RepID=A0AA36GVL9_CYLNA|nr:unnamed protein product [Cylicocyclus nassatus]
MISSQSQSLEDHPVDVYHIMKVFRQAFIAVVDSGDSWLTCHFCITIERAPPIIISHGTLDFEIVRQLFLCGTEVVIEVDNLSPSYEIEEIINEICETDDLPTVLTRYNSILRSADCLLWQVPPLIRLDASALRSEEERADNQKPENNSVPSFLLETQHISNLWLNRTRKRRHQFCKLFQKKKVLFLHFRQDGDRKNDILSETVRTLLRTLSKVTTIPTRQRKSSSHEENRTVRKKRRRKKMENMITRDYMSDSGEKTTHKPAHCRSLSDFHTSPM